MSARQWRPFIVFEDTATVQFPKERIPTTSQRGYIIPSLPVTISACCLWKQGSLSSPYFIFFLSRASWLFINSPVSIGGSSEDNFTLGSRNFPLLPVPAHPESLCAEEDNPTLGLKGFGGEASSHAKRSFHSSAISRPWQTSRGYVKKQQEIPWQGNRLGISELISGLRYEGTMQLWRMKVARSSCWRRRDRAWQIRGWDLQGQGMGLDCLGDIKSWVTPWSQPNYDVLYN